jgi:polysaccharide pyruvyl transferase WcaK-like protein
MAAIRRADLTIWLAGSGLFSDARGCTLERFWPLFRRLRWFARRLAILSASVGPIRFERTRELIRKITSQVDALATRDGLSARNLHEIVGEAANVVAMADLALEMTPAAEADADAFWARAGLDRDGHYLAFCPLYFYQTPEQVPRVEEYKRQFYAAIAGALKTLRERRGLTPLMIPFQGDWDERISREIAGMLDPPARVLPAGLHPATMQAVLARMRLAIGVRLHAQILSLTAGTPLVPILYDDKCMGFAEDAGLLDRGIVYPYWVAERDPLDEARLTALAERALDEKEAFERRLGAAATEMRERNRQGTERLWALGVLAGGG